MSTYKVTCITKWDVGGCKFTPGTKAMCVPEPVKEHGVAIELVPTTANIEAVANSITINDWVKAVHKCA